MIFESELTPVREWTWKEYQIETDGVLRTQRKAPYVGHGKDRDIIFELGRTWTVTAMPPDYYEVQNNMIPFDEPDIETGCYRGMKYLLLRGGSGAFCGYVELATDHLETSNNKLNYIYSLSYRKDRVIGFDNSHEGQHFPLQRGKLAQDKREDHWYTESYVYINQAFDQVLEMIDTLNKGTGAGHEV